VSDPATAAFLLAFVSFCAGGAVGSWLMSRTWRLSLRHALRLTNTPAEEIERVMHLIEHWTQLQSAECDLSPERQHLDQRDQAEEQDSDPERALPDRTRDRCKKRRHRQ
jgi:hypothetical protein